MKRELKGEDKGLDLRAPSVMNLMKRELKDLTPDRHEVEPVLENLMKRELKALGTAYLSPLPTNRIS